MSVSSFRSRGDKPFKNAPVVGGDFATASGRALGGGSQQVDTTTDAANAEQFDMSLGTSQIDRVVNLVQAGDIYKALQEFSDFMNSDAVPAADKDLCIELVAVELVEAVAELNQYAAHDLALVIEEFSADLDLSPEAADVSALMVAGDVSSLVLDNPAKPTFMIDPAIMEIARAKQAADELRYEQALPAFKLSA